MKKLEGKVAFIRKARDLVFKVIADGWQDLPFDPFWFAEYRRLTITPRDDIPNARLVSESSIGIIVEFDPNEPQTKVHFSLAHEIGLVLFPDFGLTFQNRLKMSMCDFSDQARKFRTMICKDRAHRK
jgi:hypothetical protein